VTLTGFVVGSPTASALILGAAERYRSLVDYAPATAARVGLVDLKRLRLRSADALD
jgi:hypothetical protein